VSVLRALLALPPGAGSMATPIDLLHAFVITVTMISAVGVFAIVAWYCVRDHRRVPRQTTRFLGVSVARETTVVAAILGTFLVWWLIGYRQYLQLRNAPADASVVYVTAKQWMWKFEYPEGTASTDVLVVPVGRPTKVVMTSRDVIHSFYVPPFRIKQDVVPGRTTTAWFTPTVTGHFPIWCAEYCGTSHSRMRGEVHVMSDSEYAAWSVVQGRSGAVAMAQMGADIAAHRACLACHTLNGAPHVGPTWSRLYASRVKLEGGAEVVADEAYLTRSMMEPQVEIVAGYAGRPMPTYRGTLSPAETAAIVELIKSLRDGEIPSGIRLPVIANITLDAGASPQSPFAAGAPAADTLDGGTSGGAR